MEATPHRPRRFQPQPTMQVRRTLLQRHRGQERQQLLAALITSLWFRVVDRQLQPHPVELEFQLLPSQAQERLLGLLT